MTTTPDLIHALAANLRPVRRLRSPAIRAAFWLLLAACVVALLAVSQGIRPDLAERSRDLSFVAMLAGALLTGLTAALSAFMLSVPGRSSWWAILPLPPLAFWMSNIGYQCLTNWVVIDPSGISFGEATRCFATLVLTSLPLSLALFVMLRHAAALRPMAVALTGGLSVAAITALALFLFHILDASLLVIMWNLGTAMLVVGLSALLTARYVRRAKSLLSA